MKHLGRKLFHLLGGLGLLSLYFLLGRNSAFLCYGALILIVLAFETVRLTLPVWNRFLYTYFGSFIRKNEERKLTGTAPYILGVGLSLYAYSAPVASAAICFLAFGDVAATTVGERFGRTKIGDKSLEGSAAFVAAALAAGLLLTAFGLGLAAWIMLLGALVAAGVELLTLRVNDNLLIPVITGAVMELALRLTA
jgi:acyl phosphate:glycerol-3-phosphate acyltransferase